MLPHAKGLRNLGVDSVELWLRSVSLLKTAIVFAGRYFERGAIDQQRPSVSSALGVSRSSGGRRRLMLSWKRRG